MAQPKARLRRAITIVLVAVVALALICGVAFWRWYSWITTPPGRITLEQLPSSTIEDPRMAAEWEPATGALIAWPFHLPRELVVALASDVQLYITVKDDVSRQRATRTLTSWGIAPTACTFIVAPQGDGWYGTRDWGPFAVFDDSGNCYLADAYYIDYPVSGPGRNDSIYWLTRLDDLDFQPDGQAPAAVAQSLGLPRVELPFALTGGAVATDGRGTAFITQAVIRENEAFGVPKDQFYKAAEALLGLKRFIVVPNYEEMGVHHIDCLLALLDSERILVKRPPRDHHQYEYAEEAVDILSRQMTPSGTPYEILRIDTPRYAEDLLANYANALILNRKVYVPLFGIDADEQALETWRRVMPGYEILGFKFGGEDGWTYTDAVHCRIKAIWDARPAHQ